MHQRLILLLTAAFLAAFVTSLMPVTPAEASPARHCITKMQPQLRQLSQEYQLTISADAPIVEMEFGSFINMTLTVPGERMQQVADYTWKVPSNTTTVSFRFNHYDAGQDAFMTVVIHDACGTVEDGMFLIEAEPTSLLAQYPYPPFNQPRARPAVFLPITPAQVPPNR